MLKTLLALLILISLLGSSADAQLYGNVHKVNIPNGMYLGMHVNQPVAQTDSDTAQAQALEGLENQIGGRFRVTLFYSHFSALTVGQIAADPKFISTAQYNRIPNIAITCLAPINADATHTGLLNGEFDAQLHAAAAGIKSYGHPVMIRYFWEFNANIFGSNTNGQPTNPPCFYQGYTDIPGGPTAEQQKATDFINSWIYIWTLFRNDNVKNVSWVWCPIGHIFANGMVGDLNGYDDLKLFKPPDQYLDFIGFDAYDKLNVGFQNTVDSFYQTATTTGSFSNTVNGKTTTWTGWGEQLPLFLNETGEINNNTGTWTQAKYFQDILTISPVRYKQLKGVAYFSSDPKTWDWQLDPAAIQELQSIVNLPYFQQ